VQAAEHWMKGDLGDNNLDVSVDVAQTFKNNRDSFLKEAMQVLQSAFVKGLCERVCKKVVVPKFRRCGFEVSSRSHSIQNS
jgi:hypothetical protein